MQEQDKNESIPRRMMDVIHHVQQLIDDGSLQPGDKLPPEREFAKLLKMSRGSVRSGIDYLAGMGVMEVRHGVGTFLADCGPYWKNPSFDMLRTIHGFQPEQMVEVRSILESAAVALAAERGRDKYERELAEEVAEMYAAVDSPNEFLTHEVRFHHALAEASGNPVLTVLMDRITVALFANPPRASQTAGQRWATADLCREIYKTIRKSDAAACRCWRRFGECSVREGYKPKTC